MHSFVYKGCLVILRKVKHTVILSSTFSTTITLSSFPNLKKIIKTEFIKRDLCTNTVNYETVKYNSKQASDEQEKTQLQQLLENPEIEKKYKLLKYELEYMDYLGTPVPKNIQPKDWIKLLLTPTKSQQRKYIQFMFKNEMKAMNFKTKKLRNIEYNLQSIQEFNESCPSGIKYGISNNSFFLRIYDKTMDRLFNHRAIHHSMFEPSIVFDCGYNHTMADMELSNCAKQILISMTQNRLFVTPCNLYLCNASPHSRLLKMLQRMIPSLYSETFPLNIRSESYLDIFDKSKLVYLTPHCRTNMTSYDPDTTYIIGAIVDKKHPKPYTLAKAKKEGITMQRFPLEKYLSWGTGSGKSLTLNQTLGILLDMKYSKNWTTAFQKHVPSRKLVNENKVDNKEEENKQKDQEYEYDQKTNNVRMS